MFYGWEVDELVQMADFVRAIRYVEASGSTALVLHQEQFLSFTHLLRLTQLKPTSFTEGAVT